ncbi:hypothetical protein OTU49_016574, partial [Cherax quadricarinatus]
RMRTKGSKDESGREEWEVELKKREEDWGRRLDELERKMEERLAAECRRWKQQATAAEIKIERLEEELRHLKQHRDITEVASAMATSNTDNRSEESMETKLYAEVLSNPHGAKTKAGSTLGKNERLEDIEGTRTCARTLPDTCGARNR